MSTTDKYDYLCQCIDDYQVKQERLLDELSSKLEYLLYTKTMDELLRKYEAQLPLNEIENVFVGYRLKLDAIKQKEYDLEEQLDTYVCNNCAYLKGGLQDKCTQYDKVLGIHSDCAIIRRPEYCIDKTLI